MATHTATRLMRSFPQRFGLNTPWNGAICNTRRYFYTGDRYQGYVSFFQPDELFGFLVRDDVPDQEYYFHSTDLHTRNIPRVRPLQQVEFSIVEGRGGNYIAREITGPNSSDLEFNHPNMRLPQNERTKLLSELPNGLHERHKGIIVTIHADGSGGYIVPDRMNFQVVQFRTSELQSTGIDKVDRFSEVEFFVRPPANRNVPNPRDRALCITRPGGGLITGERKDIGSRRRQLGAMYGPTDTKARLPQDFISGRERGIVSEYFPDKLFGFVTSVDNPSTNAVFVHCDDCHISGKRLLRKNQIVEFKRVTDEQSGRTKALHVTGPNSTVLHNISQNHYLPNDLLTKDLEVDENRRRVGTVVHIDRENRGWFIVKPSERGYKSIFAPMRELKLLGNQGNLEIGNVVEFTVGTNELENNNDNNNEGNDRSTLTKAVNVTGEGGYPLVLQPGKYGRYLQSKLNLPTLQSELELAPLSEEQFVYGYVTRFSRAKGYGTIEVEAPDGVRYQKVRFSVNDVILPDNMDPNLAMINNGLVIKFNVNDASGEITDEEKEMQEKGVTIFTRKATNITSADLNYLQCREFKEYGSDDYERRERRGNFNNNNRQNYQQQEEQRNEQGDETKSRTVASSTGSSTGQRKRQGKTVTL